MQAGPRPVRLLTAPGPGFHAPLTPPAVSSSFPTRRHGHGARRQIQLHRQAEAPGFAQREKREEEGPQRGLGRAHRLGHREQAGRRRQEEKAIAPGMVARRKLRIATFNVNGIRPRLPHLLQWLAKEKPDIACLQELKATDGQFPAAEIEAAGYGALWVGQPSWNGVAVLTRDAEPVESRRTLPGDRADEQSRYLEVAAHGVIVACLYLPNGNPRPGPKF